MTQPPHEPTPGGARTMGDVLELPEPLRALVLWLLRHGEAGLPEVMAAAGLDEAPCRALVETLVARGFLHGADGGGAPRYRARLAARRPRPAASDIWERLQG
jgi:hypothetical protein